MINGSGTMTERPEYELRTDDPSCPKCGYSLKGIVSLSGARCPECGARLPFHRLRFPPGAFRWNRKVTMTAMGVAVRIVLSVVVFAAICGVCHLLGAPPLRGILAASAAVVIPNLYRLALPCTWLWFKVFTVVSVVLILAFADWREELVILVIVAIGAAIWAGSWVARERASTS